jgi:hypothetical protein
LEPGGLSPRVDDHAAVDALGGTAANDIPIMTRAAIVRDMTISMRVGDLTAHHRAARAATQKAKPMPSRRRERTEAIG